MAEQSLGRVLVVALAPALGVVAALVLHLEAVILVLAGVAAAAIGVVLMRLALGHTLLTHRLRREAASRRIAGVEVQVVSDVAPMVAGLVRPTVFCDDSLTSRLDRPEQRAVLLHERGHQRVKDPLRLLGIEAVERCLGFLPGVRRRTTRARARLEIRADRYALDHGASRGDLARALVRLSDLAPATTAGFAEVTEERIRALTGDSGLAHRQRVWPRVVVVVVLVGTLFATLLATDHPELTWFSDCLTSTCGIPR